jgi:large subunit ribosomal protein L25
LELKLKAQKRQEAGKGAARKARARGEVPAVMYGLGGASVSLMVRSEDLNDAIGSEAGLNVLLDLQVTDGKQKDSHLVMIKELQKHPFKEKLLHVDFPQGRARRHGHHEGAHLAHRRGDVSRPEVRWHAAA